MNSIFSRLFSLIFLPCIFICFYVSTVFAVTDNAPINKNNFTNLESKLISDGFDPVRIKKIYDNPKTVFSPKGVSTFFIYSESKLNYNQFTSKKSIKKAKSYMELHKKKLDDAEKKFGVDKTVITAIILVETRLGTYVGKRSILNTLSTIASFLPMTMPLQVLQTI